MSKFKDGLVQNMLFAVSPGTGKTSTAKAVVNQFNLSYLYINASTDTSVDVIRTRIINFCSTVSIMDSPGAFKVVILDEVDGVSDQFFKTLRLLWNNLLLIVDLLQLVIILIKFQIQYFSFEVTKLEL